MLTRVVSVLTLTVFAVMFAACSKSGNSPAATGPATESAGAKMKVGLLVFGDTSDGGWNEMAKTAMDKLAEKDNLEVRIRQHVTEAEAADAMRQFDSQGYPLIIGHGHEYLEAAKEVTDPSKPGAVKAKIVVSGGDVDNPNFQSLNYDLSGASYELGVLAAKVSKTGKFGFIGGDKSPALLDMVRGFEAGAKSANPNATFAEAFTGWDDPAKSKREAEAFIAQGIDVIMQNVDAASRGVFEAVKENNNDKSGVDTVIRPTVYTFGANADQNANPICGDYTLGSAIINVEKAFAAPIKEVKDGTFKGGIVNEGVGSGVCVVVLNPKLLGNVISAKTQKAVEETAKKLADGEVKIPKK